MARYFTHNWSNLTWEDHRTRLEGENLEHTAGNQFRKRGVDHGDFVYVVTVHRGALLLGGSLQVDRVTGQQEAEKHFGEPVWQASDHLISIPGSNSRMNFDREVPADTVRQLQFITEKGHTRVRFKSGNVLAGQAMRGVRELTPESARLLDVLLGT